MSTVAIPTAPPVLSTPDDHILEGYQKIKTVTALVLSDEQLNITYEIKRTISEIRKAQYKRVALQFPDHYLPHAPRVSELLREGLKDVFHEPSSQQRSNLSKSSNDDQLVEKLQEIDFTTKQREHTSRTTGTRFYILGDTSYGACCVDEIAAEHINADVVVHYGRACLSPTKRLPVIHIFTHQMLDHDAVVQTFLDTYPDKTTKIILLSDVTYDSHLTALTEELSHVHQYENIFRPEVIHDPTSLIPNRTLPESVDLSNPLALQDAHIFHISTPPPALLLTLDSRVSSIHIFPTSTSTSTPTPTTDPSSTLANPIPLLKRRYALLSRLRHAPIIGILINTLSSSSTLPTLAALKSLIASKGKKSYTVVVGKVNAAKLANFAEIEGWVVVGCWESSLLDDEEGKGGMGWWKPCVTPWELGIALGEEGGWRGIWEAVGDVKVAETLENGRGTTGEGPEAGIRKDADTIGEGKDKVNAGPLEDEEESEPPEFDLRTGKYVTNTRPMRVAAQQQDLTQVNGDKAQALVKRAKGELAVMNGHFSPGAAFFKEKRTWQGLGSDHEIRYDDARQGSRIEEGRSGVARGYVGESAYGKEAS